MVVVDDRSLKQADSQPKSCGLVWGSAAAWRCSTFIKWTEWTLAMTLWLWWQHYKYRPGYFVIIIECIIIIVIIIIIIIYIPVAEVDHKSISISIVSIGWSVQTWVERCTSSCSSACGWRRSTAPGLWRRPATTVDSWTFRGTTRIRTTPRWSRTHRPTTTRSAALTTANRPSRRRRPSKTPRPLNLPTSSPVRRRFDFDAHFSFDFDSTPIRLQFDRATTVRRVMSLPRAALLRCGLNKLCGSAPQYAPAPCKLTFDLLTLKVTMS